MTVYGSTFDHIHFEILIGVALLLRSTAYPKTAYANVVNALLTNLRFESRSPPTVSRCIDNRPPIKNMLISGLHRRLCRRRHHCLRHQMFFFRIHLIDLTQ